MTLDGEILPGIANQTRRALENIGHILNAANAHFGNGKRIEHCLILIKVPFQQLFFLSSVVKTNVLLANIADSAAMSEVYGECE